MDYAEAAVTSGTFDTATVRFNIQNFEQKSKNALKILP
jgi:hypothetical protein